MYIKFQIFQINPFIRVNFYFYLISIPFSAQDPDWWWYIIDARNHPGWGPW